MRKCLGVGVVGLFLSMTLPALAQGATGMVAYFGGRKIACDTAEVMVYEAQKDRSGRGDGLVVPSCVLLAPHTAAFIDIAHPIEVPGCDDVYVYHIYLLHKGRRGKVGNRDYYIELSDIADADLE